MAKQAKPKCGAPGCDADATVKVQYGKNQDHYNYACIEHIGDMLTDEYQHTVTWLYPNPATGP